MASTSAPRRSRPTRPAVAGPGEPLLRWSSRATTIAGIQLELARIWSEPKLVASVDGVEERRIAARTSVMNLVVIALRPEIGKRAAATIARLTGRHPSRTLIVLARDPEGRNSLRARIEAHCILPRADAPETCAEMIHLEVGGQAGRHLAAVVAPLLVHDLPVTLWWPDEPPFGAPEAEALFRMADRLVVDGSSWGGDGLDRLSRMAATVQAHGLAVSDLALVRQSRWREAIASVFDMPGLLPYLRYVRRIAVTYAAAEASAPAGGVNVVKPVYHVAWLASRLGMTVREPVALRAERRRSQGTGAAARVHAGLLEGPHGEVKVTIGPLASELPSGTTLRVELLCDRRGSELRAAITAAAETVDAQAWVDGLSVLQRSYLAPRRTDVDLLEEAVESGTRDPVAAATIRFAAELAARPSVERPDPVASEQVT
jgi:glucose-6-phosphate dehydrogenase assembly protein OpcA